MSEISDRLSRSFEREGHPRGVADIMAVDALQQYEASNGSSYRILSAAVEKLMGEHTDPNRWDGDDAAPVIESEFLGWLPDIVLHATANRLREEGIPDAPWGSHRHNALHAAANKVDPFRLCEEDGCDQSPHWIRKRDGENVPWRVIGNEGED